MVIFKIFYLLKDELLAELNELEQEGIEKELMDIQPPSSSLPADKVPAKATAKKVDDDEDELRKMADWAS